MPTIRAKQPDQLLRLQAIRRGLARYVTSVPSRRILLRWAGCGELRRR